METISIVIAIICPISCCICSCRCFNHGELPCIHATVHPEEEKQNTSISTIVIDRITDDQ
jgi:hypothetical protein